MKSKVSHILWVLLLIVSLLAYGGASHSQDTKSYIVYLGDLPKDDIESPTSLHIDLLQQVTGRNSVSKSLDYSFKRSFSGFVVNLTEEEMRKMAAMKGVVSVFPNEKRQLLTTRSWDFLGFTQQVSRTRLENDIIIGVIDSGIWPESESFSDTGYGPPPASWKGGCQSSANFNCNNKIIGAQFYRVNHTLGWGDEASPRDTEGHGTHTASTAAGNLVNKASLFGLGEGTARGGVPAARIAVYKVCWSDGCSDADIMAAFDDAIADGVDIISGSLGFEFARHYFHDSIAIGSFHAMKRNILTSVAAGNAGPRYATSSNIAPWALSVAASTTDRRFFTKVKLGNGYTFQGRTINTYDLGRAYPLIYGGDAPSRTTSSSGINSRFCYKGTLDPNLIKDKIVLCDIPSDMTGQVQAGAIGTIMYGEYVPDASVCPIPASYYLNRDQASISAYLRSTRTPTATIYKSESINDRSAPFVIPFSSRGPNNVTRDILKPDLSAPGVEIVAAWSGIGSISLKGDPRKTPYNIISGTSMACPHATGAAAYVKSFRPTWSPAAIKSALMTTATPMSRALNPQAEFAYGSGNIDPIRALNPGLVYDANEVDYARFLCGQGYTDDLLRAVTGDRTSTCTSGLAVWNLNYPSMAFSVSANSVQAFRRVFNRVVTNVGPPRSTYHVTVTGVPAGLIVDVNPSVLSFTSTGQSLAFAVQVRGTITGQPQVLSASLVWSDGVHRVRAPIVVYNIAS